MNRKHTNMKPWLVAVALSVLIGGAAAALPDTASARMKPSEHRGVYTKVHISVNYKKRGPSHARITSRRPMRTIVVHRPGLRLWCPAMVASFSYHLNAAPRYTTSAPIYTSVETAVSNPRYTSVQRISVSIDLLNVRSGPDLNKPVICTVGFGEVLHVQGTAQGWLHVTLPDGRPGWVMERYTTRM
jgi:uncharacterized protein YgiM (DUF1202 family)